MQHFGHVILNKVVVENEEHEEVEAVVEVKMVVEVVEVEANQELYAYTITKTTVILMDMISIRIIQEHCATRQGLIVKSKQLFMITWKVHNAIGTLYYDRDHRIMKVITSY